MVHGFSESVEQQWLNEIKDKILQVDTNANVILVDWSAGSAVWIAEDWNDWINGPIYGAAAANTRVVGKKTAEFVKGKLYIVLTHEKM